MLTDLFKVPHFYQYDQHQWLCWIHIKETYGQFDIQNGTKIICGVENGTKIICGVENGTKIICEIENGTKIICWGTVEVQESKWFSACLGNVYILQKPDSASAGKLGILIFWS